MTFLNHAATRGGIAFMQLLAWLPLPVIRALGALLGRVLYALAGSRRRVVHTNLRLCFAERSEAEREQLARQTFVYFAQAWLDRSWLWHAPARWIERRVSLTGALDELTAAGPAVAFVPHFVGMDAAWAGVTLRFPRPSASIYTDQSNTIVDQWILKGRRRFGNLNLFARVDGAKPVVQAVRQGQPLYLLADMDFGRADSVFVPFFGVPAATVPSLHRFARLGRARVFAVVSTLTPTGYQIRILPTWPGFPTGDLTADTALMNQHLEDYIRSQPAQYYWVHRRFKTRPEGVPGVY